MVSIDQFRTWALAYPHVVELPHFEKTSFRVKQRIFATVDITRNQACLKLTEIEQDVFSKGSKGALYPVPNRWGKQGWTFVELNSVTKKLCEAALRSAYETVANRSRL